jgi:hypothetical protein
LLAPIRDAFTTDSTLKNQNVSDFYDTSDKLTVNANRLGATDEDVLANKYINSVKTEIGELYGEKREIQNSDLSDSEKYYLVRDLQKKINRLSEKALGEYKNVNIDGNYATVGDRQYRLTDNGWEKLSDEQIEKQDGSLAVRQFPNLPRKILPQVLGLCNIVGQMAKAKDSKGEMRWYLVTEDSETRYGCKDQLYGRKSCMPDKLFEAPEVKK